MKQDARESITNKIIQSLERGEIPWDCPFDKQIMPVNYKTKKEYRGMNLVMLWLEARFMGYTGNHWIGFKQANELGGKVKKGQHGTPIIVCCPFKKEVKNKHTGEDEEVKGNYFKVEHVFNLYSQVEGIEFEESEATYKPIEEFDSLIERVGINVRNSGERAYYSTADDFINMPFFSKFKTQEDYYATLAHESIHYTMTADRCSRTVKDDEERALEELTAELGAAFLCAEFGIKTNLDNNAGYIQSWLKALKDDTNYIFKASKQASEAVNFLLSHQGSKAVTEEAAA